MKKRITLLILMMIPFLIFFGCNQVKPLDINTLTRVDVQHSNGEGGYDANEIIIADEESISKLREIFSDINWEENVKIQWSRFEDVKLILFFDVDKNMPERLVEYFIWFEDNDTAVFSQRDENRIGKLDKETTQILKKLILLE